jgi:thiamine-phosphate pyrophosphorylase
LDQAKFLSFKELQPDNHAPINVQRFHDLGPARGTRKLVDILNENRHQRHPPTISARKRSATIKPSVGKNSEKLATPFGRFILFILWRKRAIPLLSPVPPSQPPKQPVTSSDEPPTPAGQSGIYRILDANLNRCVEGLRVVEEYLRFVLEDRHLASACKQLRHDVAHATRNLPSLRLQSARDSAHDIGASISTDSELHRLDARAVAAASWKRAQQALRSLEEYSKVVAAPTASEFETLRFRTYTLEASAHLLEAAQDKLADVKLYVLLDGRSSATNFEQLVRQLVSAGVDAIQLRDKQLNDRELVQRAKLLRQLTHESDCLFVMNDRPDLALLAAADGVHVGQDELTVRDVRSVVGPDMLIGVSTHTLAQAEQAVLDGAQYIGCGPTFASRTKSFPDFAGLEFLRQVSQRIRLPAFAIGGINLANLPQVLQTGFRRVAMQHAIVTASDPAAVIGEIRMLLDNRE